MFLVSRQTRLTGSAAKILAVSSVATAAAIFSLVFGAVTFGAISPADALPSYARQTGQPAAPATLIILALLLTAACSSWAAIQRAGANTDQHFFLRKMIRRRPSADTQKSGESPSKTGESIKPYAPPISMMAIVGFTHTQADQDPTGSPYSANDNVVVAPVSFFYGGAITDHIGAFAQLTYTTLPLVL